MRSIDIFRLVLLAALWGGSFTFVRVGAPALGAIWFTLTRALVGSVLLLAWLRLSGVKFDLRRNWKAYLLIGAVNTAFPWLLFSWAGKTVSASYMTLLNAASPWFSAMIGMIWLAERMTAQKLAGLVTGFIGVAVLVALGPIEATPEVLAALFACLVASASYAAGAVLAQLMMRDANYKALATGNVVMAFFLLLPLVPFSPPPQTWSPVALACAAGIGLLGTGIGFPLYFRLVSDIGATRTNTTTFIIPLFGILSGALFLDEPLPATLLLGAALSLIATAMVLELFRMPRGGAT